MRPFQPGDRIRRVDWRVSLRTQQLHVAAAPAEQDHAVLLLLDVLADHGASGGLGGEESSLDRTVRVTAALAEHHLRHGDRVAVRTLDAGDPGVPGSGGTRQLRRVQVWLSDVRAGDRDADPDLRRLGVRAGTTAILLSPLLSETAAAAAAALLRRGVEVMVVDTLPPTLRPAVPPGADPRVAALAWRMRRLERDLVVARLGALGCAVVAWRGPGTLDGVLRSAARRGPARRR